MAKRYDMYQDYDMLVKPEEFEGGDWVYYDDHAAELATLRAEVERLRGYLRRIAEGNLGDEPWQASYEVIRHVAKEALK